MEMNQGERFPVPETRIIVDEEEFEHFMEIMNNPQPPSPALLAGYELWLRLKPRA